MNLPSSPLNSNVLRIMWEHFYPWRLVFVHVESDLQSMARWHVFRRFSIEQHFFVKEKHRRHEKRARYYCDWKERMFSQLFIFANECFTLVKNVSLRVFFSPTEWKKKQTRISSILFHVTWHNQHVSPDSTPNIFIWTITPCSILRITCSNPVDEDDTHSSSL